MTCVLIAAALSSALVSRPIGIASPQGLHSTAYGPFPQGFVQEWFSGAGRITTSKNSTLTLQGNDRAYMVDDFHANAWSTVHYRKLNLLGKTLKYTADFSGVECGCNAGLYLVAMSAPTPSSSNYCDVQMKDKACLEIDVQEANRKAMATTLHTRYEFKNSSELPDSVCNQWGCGVTWGKSNDIEYGQHSTTGVDSSRPYDVEASFDEQGHMEVTIVQDAKRRIIWNVTKAGTPNGHAGVPERESATVKQAMSAGMVLVTSLWAAPGNDMSWLDGGCTKAYPHCDLASTRAIYHNIRVESSQLVEKDGD